MNKVRLAVIGSRDFPSRYLVERLIYEIPKDIVLVSGGARGVDTWVEVAAKHHNRQIDIYPANWSQHGKNAGFVRNNQIIRNSDLVLAFWSDKSKGTKHSIQLAKYLGKTCIVVKAV